ncbi:MAG: efflux RND transporter permease subunit [Pseudomonadota bacterium]
MSNNPYTALIDWFARNSVAANLLMAILIVGGLASAMTIKKESQPQIVTNEVSIRMPFLGASPEDVEEGVLVRIEEAIQDVEGIKEIRSTATRGLGSVVAEVLDEYDVTEVMNEIKTRVDAIQTFPDNTEKPTIYRNTFQEQVLIVSVHGDVSERTLKEYAKQVRNDIMLLPGVSRAVILGARDYEISIEVSEYTLQKYDLTLADVARAIGRGSLDLPAGSIRSQAGDIQVRTKGQAYVGRDFEDIVIRTNENGSRLLLKDIANIRDGFEERGRFSEFDGQPAISIEVLSVGSENELQIAETVRNWVDERKDFLPDGISVDYWADITYYLEGRLDLMLKNLFFGALLVFLSLSLFLRLKLAFWVMVGLPVAFLGTFLFLPTVDVTVNLISLFGFIVVLGIVVDDAIVVGESAYTSMREKGHSVSSIVEGVHRVAVPATFGVLTTIAAFMPVLLVSGPSGQFMAPIGWVVVLCLAFSIVESKLILPAHLAHMKVKHYDENTTNPFVRFQRFFSEGLHKIIDRYYAPFLERCLKRRYLSLSIFIGALILSIGLVAGGILRTVFFPDLEGDFMRVSVQMNEGTPSEQTHAALRQLVSALGETDAELSAELGREPGSVVNHVLAIASGQTAGRVIVELVKYGSDGPTSGTVLRDWRERAGDIPGVKQLGFSNRAGGPGGGPALSIQLSGPDNELVARASRELERRIGAYDGVYDLRNSSERGRPEVQLNIKPEAETLGLTLSDLANQVRAGFYGQEVQRIQRGQEEVKVMVRYPESERDSVGYLDSMRVRTPNGGRVPFEAVAEIELTESPLVIQRFDRERAVRVTAEVDKEIAEPDKIIADIVRREMPALQAQFPGVRVQLRGSSQRQGEVQGDLLVGAALALFMIYALMAIPLRSYAQPLLIMSVIPFGMIGALFGHLLLDIPVSMLSYFGIIALSGVVVNDSLILVDYINKEKARGVPTLQAVVEGARMRFRPILLTSLTTFLGLAPITFFESSGQAQLVVPMATSLAFGIVFATVITLILIPALYLILDDFAAWWRAALDEVIPGRKKARQHDHPFGSKEEGGKDGQPVEV